MPALLFIDCCGCIDLKIGSFIIGYFHMIAVCFGTIVGAASLVMFSLMMPEIKATPEQFIVALISIVILGIFVFLLLLALAFAIVLLVGLHKNKPGHLKAYLVYSMIFIGLMVFRLVASGISSGVSMYYLSQHLAAIITSTYFYLVIRSRYYQMKKEMEIDVNYAKNVI